MSTQKVGCPSKANWSRCAPARKPTPSARRPKGTISGANRQPLANPCQIAQDLRAIVTLLPVPPWAVPSSSGPPLQDDHAPPRADGGLSLADCRSQTALFADLVRHASTVLGVGARAVAVRALLHLPRVASRSGWIGHRNLQREIWTSAERLRIDARAAQNQMSAGTRALAELCFEQIDSDRANLVFRSLHYLRSSRAGSRSFGLVDPSDRRPVCLVSISRLEWARVKDEISAQFDVSPEAIWEISRMYSIDGAPANVISCLLAKLRAHLRRREESIDLLTTAVDPNLGFTGASYKAANWQQWMTVVARPYMYEWSAYVTPRQLREWYGTSNLYVLRAQYPRRFEQSRARLLDSLIFCCRIKEETEVIPVQLRRRAHR
jgi:hypothetical protein